MLSHEILEKLAPMFQPRREKPGNSFLPPSVELAEQLIARLSDHFDGMIGFLGKIAEGNEANYQILIYRHIASTSEIVSAFSSRKVFVSFESLIELANDFSEWGSPSDNIGFLLANNIESLCDDYDAFLSAQTTKNAFALIYQANTVHNQLYAVSTVLHSVYELLDESAQADDEEKSASLISFSILLPVQDDFARFVQRLNAIKRLYEEISELLGASHTESPLKIGKIESGSLWVKLFGESKVVALLTRFIEQGAGYVYRKFTDEGQIAAIPRKIESLDRVIGLRSSLQEIGIDTADMDEQIAKSGIAIAKNLNVLLERQSSVKVNGRLTSVSDEMLRKQIESHPWPMLEHVETPQAPDDGGDSVAKR